MSAYFRRIVAEKIVRSLNEQKRLPHRSLKELQDHLASAIRLREASKKYSLNEPQLQLCLSRTSDIIGQSCDESIWNIVSNQASSRDGEDTECSLWKNRLLIKLNPSRFSQHVLEAVRSEGPKYGYEYPEYASDESAAQAQTVLVEYSSPNIAKPFHAGHLRSTIIGNFVANLYEALGHRVIRLNYLGDWGTQFGLLVSGFRKYGSMEELDKDPMLHLFQVYVKINQDVEDEAKMSERKIYVEGLEMFKKLEEGDPELVRLWKKFSDVSLEEYHKMYERLGVKFTDTHTESMYNAKTRDLIDRLKEKGLIQFDDSGVGFMDVDSPGKLTCLRAKLVKSDGATLYLSRDVAAALDRRHRYKFGRMHYVVEMGQRLHFEHLVGVLKKLGESWIERPVTDIHIQFGRIEGMSTRKGEVVFLRDILDEARKRMLDTMKQKDTTKEKSHMEEVADTLGISSIIVQDLKQKRLRTYQFHWDRMLNFKADSGIFLQYCHARLCSIRKHCGVELQNNFNVDYLEEDSAQQLILHISRYPEVVKEAYSSLEPCHIVQYLFKLGHFANSAYSKLPVKGEDSPVAQARLHVFECARQTLANGMTLLGLKPLEKM